MMTEAEKHINAPLEETGTISYEETIEAIVDVYRQEFMKLSIEELDSIPHDAIKMHAWSIKILVKGGRDEN
jgi:hypothetical protein